MKESKYYIIADGVGYYSNSRNARQHLKDTGARIVTVYINDKIGYLPFVCQAMRTQDCIMVGARRIEK